MKHILLGTYLYLMSVAVFPKAQREEKKEVKLACEMSKTVKGNIFCKRLVAIAE